MSFSSPVVSPLKSNSIPEANRLVLATCGKVTSFMGIPAESETLRFVAQKLHLWVHSSSRLTRVLRTIPDHHPTIRAHGRDDVRVLWLISCLVHLSLVINFLGNVELDLHLGFLGGTAISTNLTPLLIVVFWVGSIGVGELHMSNLKIILSIAGRVGTD